MDPNVIAYVLLVATMVVPGLVIFVVVSYFSARRRTRPRRRSGAGKRAYPRPL
jgi:hypothetical protein